MIDLKKDLFPIFIVVAIVGMVGFMILLHYPWGIILTVVALGIGFGIVELIIKLIIGKTVSQQWWYWTNQTIEGQNKYIHCPKCKCEIVFPNKWKAQVFGVIFIVTFVIITVGHLLWK